MSSSVHHPPVPLQDSGKEAAFVGVALPRTEDGLGLEEAQSIAPAIDPIFETTRREIW